MNALLLLLKTDFLCANSPNVQNIFISMAGLWAVGGVCFGGGVAYLGGSVSGIVLMKDFFKFLSA